MAMGHLCWREMIECPYATTTGQCLDDIVDDFGLCEMYGDNLPPKDMSTEQRRNAAMIILRDCKSSF